MKKRTYSSVDVEKLDVAPLVSQLAVGCLVGIDVAKRKFVAAIGTAAGEVVRIVRFEHPRQTSQFLSLLTLLRDAKLEPHVVMEPTGTYGDAVRYQCHRLAIPVHMMSPKHTHDFAEVLDGVPSMHDPKAATALVKLQAFRPARQWEPESEARRDLRALLDQRAFTVRGQQHGYGLLEAMLARHWPELETLVGVRARSCMTLLRETPGPQAVSAASEQAAEVLRKASRGALPRESIAAIVTSASLSIGVPMRGSERMKLQALVARIEGETKQLEALDAELVKAVEIDPAMTLVAQVVGPSCAAAIVGYVGSPTSFGSASAFEKAMGLNLRERSSGEKKGRLSLTKRGASEVRQLLFLASLRLLQKDPIVAAWYRGRDGFKRETKIVAVVAVMRKIARALWHVARKTPFDASKLFDVRRLRLDDVTKDDVPSSFASSQRSIRAGGEVQQNA